MGAYSFFKYFHSGFRLIAMAMLLIAIIQSIAGWLGNKPYTEANRKMNLFALIFAHIQLIVGLVLYFLSPYVQFNSTTMKVAETRYWTVEHITMMLVAIALITVGHIRSKKSALAQGKHRSIALFYTLAIIIIVVAILHGHRPLLGISN